MDAQQPLSPQPRFTWIPQYARTFPAPAHGILPLRFTGVGRDVAVSGSGVQMDELAGGIRAVDGLCSVVDVAEELFERDT